jgi:cysteinyl-tRNA synthetase
MKHANKLGAGEKAAEFIKQADKIFGFLRESEIPSEIVKIADERQEARSKKDWKKSDLLRNKIKDMGWEIRDEKDGYELRKA